MNKIQKIISNKYFKLAFFLVILFVIAFSVFGYLDKKNQEENYIKIGFITDVHCYSKLNNDTGEWETNWRCSRPMGEFVDRMNNNFHPDFVIENGDFVDGRDRRGEDGFLRAKELYEKINAPKFYVLGNHETNNFTKERWEEIVDYNRTYYYFDLKGYRFIVLDANNTYDNVENPTKVVDMEPWMEPHSYKGMIDERQMEWLEETLKDSEGLKKIVFMHEPPLNETVGELRDDIFINPEPVRELFSKYGVKAVFSGHIEELCDVNVGGVNYFTFQGFHKKSPRLKKEDQYKDKGTFYEVTIDENDEIKIEMFFSENREEPYQSIEISQDSIVCNNDTLPVQ